MTPTPEEEATATVETLYRLQEDRLKNLKKVIANCKKDPENRKTQQYFDLRHAKVDKLYQQFNESHDVMMGIKKADTSLYVTNELADKFEETYIDAKCFLSEAATRLFPASPPPSTTAAVANPNPVKKSPVRLPRLPVPSFSGKFVDWPAFRDAFDRLIHSNEELDPIQKFHFLKEALPKGSDTDIQQMSLVETNYAIAWKLLLSRYDNARLLFMHHMQSLFSLPTLSKEKAEDIKMILNVANVCINEFTRLKLPISGCDHWIAYMIATRLPNETLKAWEHHLGSDAAIPSFNKIESFLNQRLISIDVIESRNGIDDSASKLQRSSPRAEGSKKSYAATTGIQSSKACFCCKGEHLLRRCPEFLAKSPRERKIVAEQANLCLNCLMDTHKVSRCTSPRNCRTCGKRHHTSLCFTESVTPALTNKGDPPAVQSDLNPDASKFEPNITDSSRQVSHPVQFSSNALSENVTSRVLLATAVVTLVNNVTGESANVRALIDQGSECTIISEPAVQTLRLHRTPTTTEICGVGQGCVNYPKFSVSFGMRSRFGSHSLIAVDTALVLKSVTSNLPCQTFNSPVWEHIDGLILADPGFYKSSRIDLLIGADLIKQILLPEIRLGPHDAPLAQHTRFGWVLLGKMSTTTSHTLTVRCHHTNTRLKDMIKQLYEDDNVQAETSLSAEDAWCENFFKSTHVRQSNGKYLVRLPMKSHIDPNLTLGKSKQIALNRFYSLERKLGHNDDLRKRYADGISEYFALSQITPAIKTEAESMTTTSTGVPTATSCVLPHHAILKEDSLTTKLRIVFDASCKTSNGRSLNDLLCIGRPLLNDLSAVLLNWRKHEFVFTADIQRMYRCIDMHQDDAQYQRILWRNEHNDVQEYCLTTVTFGTASAPFTAIRVLHQLADDEQATFPLAGPVLKNDIYVDDILTGSDSINSTLEIRDQVKGALQSAGMELRKWASNASQVLSNILPEHTSVHKVLQLHEGQTLKMLGICWQPESDTFTFKFTFLPNHPTTKRNMLSTTARFFDPLGWISPIIITAKILFKEACLLRIENSTDVSRPYDWDMELPSDLNTLWAKFIESLNFVDLIKIPRWLHYNPHEITSAQLHTFCDGSIAAYAACVYLRLTDQAENVYTSLVYAKAKVTPSQKLTIPRIELLGAVLATKIADWVEKSMTIQKVSFERFFWTDATIVLYWLRGDPGRLDIYVSNRVNKILASSKPDEWNHVDTTNNPADCASRGRSPSSLAKFDLWWKGPSWLAYPSSHWPKFDAKQITRHVEEAEKTSPECNVHFSMSGDSLVLRYSSYTKLIRMCAYLYRFANNSRSANRLNRTIGPLSVRDHQEALTKIVKLVQLEAFSKEIHCIKTKRPLPHTSRIKGLSPYLDNNEILRVRGRLQHSSLSSFKKNPMILPSDHFFTALAITDAHETTLHGGAQLTLAHLRHRFWIPNGRRVVQLHLRKCLTCFRQNPVPATQLMGDLPVHRINPPHKVFLATGIDFTGAIELKASRFRGATTYKGYIAIFICLATKAVHLEAVTGLSAELFLMALRRFLGRRGICKDIYSDCGTNFVGAEKVLQSTNERFYDSIRTEVQPELTKSNIKWHFNPPYSPNFGGLWESNVKSIKHHLKRVMGNSKLTFEELSTVLVGIEACLNSRPLCPLTADVNDLFVLTPGHFLTGDSLLAPPECSAEFTSLSDTFLHTQRMVKCFWRRWSSDWLAHLQTRPKWLTETKNVHVNDLVIVKEDRVPPNEWVMGRIIETHAGEDNLVRVVTLRTPKGIYKRCISKICPLPIPQPTTKP